MKRKIIKIDEDLCNGCGNCITGCAEGALQLIDGKAKLVREDFCDGFGNCIGTCPTGALTIIEREAVDFNQDAVDQAENCASTFQVMPSDLRQWPVQLHLVNPANPAFQSKELVILSTCSPVASADIHWKYLRGRAVVIACPKLDKTDPYIEKLTSIYKQMKNPKVIIVRMEVPCCGGLTAMAKIAAKKAGRDDLVLEEHVISIEGKFKLINKISY